jgi:ribose transport system ATP-binding protein
MKDLRRYLWQKHRRAEPGPSEAVVAHGEAAPLLAMKGMSKRFPGILALDEVSLDLRRGEVLAIVGENGAGKSTLLKILGGAIAADAGEIHLGGRPVDVPNVAAAKALGIALIHQELMLAPNLDVAGNVFLGNECRGGILPRIDRSRMKAEAQSLLERVGLAIPADTCLRHLTTGQRQMVEIAKALAQNARILILDEPTSSLTPQEAERLFEIIENLRRSGVAVIYVSHRIEEVLRLAERILVLRDGRRVGELDPRAASHDEIVSLMVGREFRTWFPRHEAPPGAPLLEVDSLVVPGAPAAVTFQVRRGEILGFAGLVGSGRTELMRVLFGLDRSLGGTMRLEGAAYHPRNTEDAIRHGVYLVPEDRKREGLILPMSVAQNVSLPNIANYRPRWWLSRRQEERVSRSQVARLHIKTRDVREKVFSLSGGNQQKVVLAKWLAMKPKVLILDEPTRGIDVGAKAELYRQFAALADAGVAIVMVSSEMEEVVGMSDRVVVMQERRIVGILPRQQATPANIGALMTGNRPAAREQER